MPSESDEIEAMKRRVKEMEEEAAKLREMQAKLEENKAEIQDDTDGRSIYVGNVLPSRDWFHFQVDYGSSPEELQSHFQSCGTINRVTILCDKWSGQPKGYSVWLNLFRSHAYVEFAEAASISNAMVLNESLFRNRLIQVPFIFIFDER